MTIKLPGSTWKKWDLPVHTPESLIHNYPGEKEAAWQAFIADLEALPPELKVLGINDYLFVEGYARILEERKRGRLANIDLVLPVVELRLDKFGGLLETGPDGYLPSSWSRINLHVVFDQVDPQLIREQFMPAISRHYKLVAGSSAKERWGGVLTRENLIDLGTKVIASMPEPYRATASSPLKVGFNNLNVSFDEVKAALDTHHFHGRHLIAIGKSEWDNLRWNDHTIADKKTVINEVHLVFTAAENPAAYLRARNGLKKAEVNDRLLDCSDAHWPSTASHKDRVGNCFTWIKADSTFQGLLQATHEFDDRVFIGDNPPKRRAVEQNKTKFIRSVKISKRPGSTLAEAWFDADIPLSPDLVAIIGNKGSGKSALSDIVALVGNTRHHRQFSFLKDTRFRSPRTKFAQHFFGELSWHDGTTSSRDLDKDPDPVGVERVKYLPQRYLEDLCNELGDGGSATFDAELRKIIYSHVPETDRLGKGSMDELLDFKVAEIERARKDLKGEISKVNTALLDAVHRSVPEFRKGLSEQLAAKEAELDALEGAQPKEIVDPNDSKEALTESRQAADFLNTLEANARKLDDEEAGHLVRKGSALKREAVAKRIKQSLSNHEKHHDGFVAELSALLIELGADIETTALAHLRIDTGPVDAILLTAQKDILRSDVAAQNQDEGSLFKRKQVAAAAINEAKSKLGERQRLFVLYKEELAAWERTKANVIGGPDKLGTIGQLKVEIASLELLPSLLGQLKVRRTELAKEMHAQIQAMVDEYQRLYLPVQTFVTSEEQREMNLPLNFQVRIEEFGFIQQFLGRLNQRVRGSFMGVDESSQSLRSMLQETSFATVDDSLAFAVRLDDMLHFDRRDGQNGREARLGDQMARGETAQEMLDYLYSFDYLSPRYSLTYDGQEIGQLSPGERGLLLLVFYLLVDEDDIPIVIDQPEENLDNQTIYKVLVRCIKRAKARRQVIMVTHNPNLAVVCDAEQIIYASCDKVNSRFVYESGAIEHPEIRSKVVQILEGTEPAFRNRQLKYRLG